MPLNFDVGIYVYTVIQNFFYVCLARALRLNNRIRQTDLMLKEALERFFRESCLSSEQIKKLLRGPRHMINVPIRSILEQEFILGEHYTIKQIRKLSLLWIAVLSGYTESAELLVRYGADVNEIFGRRYPQVIDEKWTILHVLLQINTSPENERLVRLVIDLGAELTARDSKGRTPLHYAVMKDRFEITELMLEKGAKIESADIDGVTPLLASVRFSLTDEMPLFLLKRGADAFAKTIYGENALHCTSLAMVDRPELARVFIEMGVSLEDEEHVKLYRPIHLATIYGKLDSIHLFLDHGANIDALATEGKFPLYLAASFMPNNRVTLAFLLEHRANIDVTTFGGRTALHVVCEKIAHRETYMSSRLEYEGIVELLLSAGANVLAEDYDGQTPFALITSGDNANEEEPPGARLLIKELALKKALQSSIEWTDEEIIVRVPTLWIYYKECLNEIQRMKLTRIVNGCTLFELLAKKPGQIAALMRNPNFETNFKNYVSRFSSYADHLVQAFERVETHYNKVVDQENVVDEGLYERKLPYSVLRKIAHFALPVEARMCID